MTLEAIERRERDLGLTLLKGEDKQLICNLLCKTLRNTRELFELDELRLDKYREIVTARFMDGTTERIGVWGDSGTALILDIVNGLLRR